MPVTRLFCGLLLGLVVASGCGLANSFGAHHVLYEEEAAFCWMCARGENACSTYRGKGQCVAPDSMATCAIADERPGRDDKGPLLFPYDVAEFALAQIDTCVVGSDEVVVEAAILDVEDDVSFRNDYDGVPAPFDLGQDVTLLLDGGEEAELLEWTTDVLLSPDDEPVYRVRFSFCVADVDATDAVLQVRDERGHSSNVMCLTPAGAGQEEAG